jgi:outer membrane receptor protein involved in Fe transport
LAIVFTTALFAQQSPPPEPAQTAPAEGDAQPGQTAPPEENSGTAPPEQQPAPSPAATAPPARARPKAKAKEGEVELEDIEVTASKRGRSERDIPGSVGAIRGVELEKMHAQGLKDYLKLVPGVMYVDVGNEEGLPIIRGISTQLGFGATPVPTGIYLDEMPFADLFSASSIPDLNPFDLERVEVLKGPQGTLFGSGAFAGAIRYIVHKPDHSVWEAKVSETLNQTEGSDGISPVTAGAVNIPIFGDAIAIRAVGLTRKDAGVYDMFAHDSNGAATIPTRTG